ncbi:MAG TPA: O-antigen ligase family protein [Clostridia bacterium]|nr:O-antigen ligase family protein [Clostridia bacterium]
MLQESLVYKFIYILCSNFSKAWQESFIAKTLRRFGAFLGRLFSNSAIVDFTAREGVVNKGYEGSVLYKAVDGLLNLPQRVLHPLYLKAEAVFAESVAFRVLKYLFGKLHLLTACFLFIALVAPYDYWNNLYSTLAIAALLLLYFMKTIVEGRTGFQTTAFNVFLVLFVICVFLSEVFSILPDLRFLGYYLTGFMMVLLLVVTLRTKKQIFELLAVALTGLTIAGVFGIYQYIIKVPVNPAWVDTTLNQGSMTRVFSFFNNPNDFAEIILIFVPFYFAMAFNAKHVLTKLLYLAMAVPPLFSILMTQARGAWIAIAIAAFVYVFFQEKRLIPVGILLAIAAVPFLPHTIIMRLRSFNMADSSFQTRIDVWQTVIPILKDYWVTGLGLGNDTLLRVVKNYYIFVDKGSLPSHSHNLYLQLWLETGITGILAFLGFILTTVKKSIRTLVHTGDKFIRNTLIAGLASLTGILANGMIEYVWFDRRVMLFFWVSAGVILATLYLQLNEGKACGGQIAQNESEAAEEEVA